MQGPYLHFSFRPCSPKAPPEQLCSKSCKIPSALWQPAGKYHSTLLPKAVPISNPRLCCPHNFQNEDCIPDRGVMCSLRVHPVSCLSIARRGRTPTSSRIRCEAEGSRTSQESPVCRVVVVRQSLSKVSLKGVKVKNLPEIGTEQLPL